MPAGLQQIWVPALGRADRCVTCHQAMAWKGFETAEEPYRTHPAEPLKTHPIEKFGCTSCHGGQGWAVDVEPAHGPVEHWEEPLLGAALGEAYSLVDNKRALMQMNCNVCHRYDRETKGADVDQPRQAARAARRAAAPATSINGRGGTIGPDLTYVGDKAPEQYDYGRLSGQKTAFAWHVAHLKDPRALVADTVMPNFHFTHRRRRRRSRCWSCRGGASPVPAAFVPGVPRTDPQTPEEMAAEERMKTGPGAWFVKTGCFVCHSISVARREEPGADRPRPVDRGRGRADAVRPDDRRLPRRSPTGTMSVVLSRQIILTPGAEGRSRSRSCARRSRSTRSRRRPAPKPGRRSH